MTGAITLAAGSVPGNSRLPQLCRTFAAAYAAQLDHFLSALAAGHPPETTALDGLAALQLADACAASAASAEVVKIAPGSTCRWAQW